MSTPDDLQRYLRELHEEYVDKVNRLLGEGREDLVWEMADSYSEEALRAILADQADPGQPGAPR